MAELRRQVAEGFTVVVCVQGGGAAERIGRALASEGLDFPLRKGGDSYNFV